MDRSVYLGDKANGFSSSRADEVLTQRRKGPKVEARADVSGVAQRAAIVDAESRAEMASAACRIVHPQITNSCVVTTLILSQPRSPDRYGDAPLCDDAFQPRRFALLNVDAVSVDVR